MIVLAPHSLPMVAEPVLRGAEFGVFREEDLLPAPAELPCTRAICISLAHRADRRAAIEAQMAAQRWPFAPVEWLDAVTASDSPQGFGGSSREWGCLRSHVAALANAWQSKEDSVLILEDDALFCGQFARRLRAFLQAVPADWDLLMLGGLGGRRESVAAGVDRITGALMSHAYLVRASILPRLLAAMDQARVPSDRVLAGFQATCRAYAPAEWLVAQSTGWSDVEQAHRQSSAFATGPRVEQPVQPLSFYETLWRMMAARPPGQTFRVESNRTGTFHLTRSADGRLRVSTGPMGLFEGDPTPPAPRTVRPSWGPPLWCRLHRGADTPSARLALVAEITAALPCSKDCRPHWQQLLATHPPTVATAAEFFAWTVDRHNDVNRRRRVVEMSLQDARKLYAALAQE